MSFQILSFFSNNLYNLRLNVRLNATLVKLAEFELKSFDWKSIVTVHSPCCLRLIKTVKNLAIGLESLESADDIVVEFTRYLLAKKQFFPNLHTIYNFQISGPETTAKILMESFKPLVYGSAKFDNDRHREDWMKIFKSESFKDTKVFLIERDQKIFNYLKKTKAELVVDQKNRIRLMNGFESIERDMTMDKFERKLEYYLRNDRITKFAHPAVIFIGELPTQKRLRKGEWGIIVEKLKMGFLSYGLKEIEKDSMESLQLVDFFLRIQEHFNGIPLLVFDRRMDRIGEWKFPKNYQMKWFFRREISSHLICVYMVLLEIFNGLIPNDHLVQIQILLKFFDSLS